MANGKNDARWACAFPKRVEEMALSMAEPSLIASGEHEPSARTQQPTLDLVASLDPLEASVGSRFGHRRPQEEEELLGRVPRRRLPAAQASNMTLFARPLAAMIRRPQEGTCVASNAAKCRPVPHRCQGV